jgi:hypothetical protein
MAIVTPHIFFYLVPEELDCENSWYWWVDKSFLTELRPPDDALLLTFDGDRLAFLCLLPQDFHQGVSILFNDGEHLSTKHNTTCTSMRSRPEFQKDKASPIMKQ